MITSIIAASAMLLVSRQAAAVEASSASALLFQCKVSSNGESRQHDFGLMYSTNPQQAVRVNDPDFLLPKVEPSHVVPVDLWPAGFALVLRDVSNDDKWAAGAIFMPHSDLKDRTLIRVHSTANSPVDKPLLYQGECGVSEGAVAEREYLELNKQ